MPPAVPRPTRWTPLSRRLLVLLLVLAIPACAGAPAVLAPPPTTSFVPGEKPPPAVRHAADIPGPACVPEHRAMFDEAMQVARTRTAEAARFARQQPDHDHLRRWFGAAPATEVADRLERTAAWLAAPPEIKLLCNDPPGCRGARMAYTSPARRILGVCPGFFRARMEGFDSRWGTLLHEATHLAAETQDHAYGPTAAQALARTDPAKAAANADNYEYFAESLPR